MIVKCVICSAEFKKLARISKTCGISCRRILRRSYYKVKDATKSPCEHCGKVFTKIGKHRHKTCTKECSKARISKNVRLRMRQRYKSLKNTISGHSSKRYYKNHVGRLKKAKLYREKNKSLLRVRAKARHCRLKEKLTFDQLTKLSEAAKKVIK